MKQKLKTIKLTETEAKIIEMLCEDTGTHFLDRGSAYGRHWQENQGRDFINEPEIKIEVWNDMVNITKNVFHFLRNYLEITEKSKKYQKLFDEFVEGHVSNFLKTEERWEEIYGKMKGFIKDPEHGNKPWLQLMREFAEIYGDESWTENTYNFDNTLSQVLQYTYFENNDGCFILLQIHGGADVRGGYSKCHVFEIGDPDDMYVDMRDINAVCKCSRWESDDCGYHWYYGESYVNQKDLFGKELDLDDKFHKLINLDKENQKVTCKMCGCEIEFY